MSTENNEPSKDTGVFTRDELNVLDENDLLRKRLIDNMVKGETLPTKVGELRIINELLNGRDSMVKTKSDARLKKKENDNSEQIVNIVEHIFKGISNRKVEAPAEIQYIDVVIDDDDFVPGEKDIQPEQLSLTDFTLKDD